MNDLKCLMMLVEKFEDKGDDFRFWAENPKIK